jgi:hypothetical protein
MQHPDIFVPYAKELHFFDSKYEAGLASYEQSFSPATNESAVGEVTPDYLAREECASRIHADLGEIPLIVSLRNPADRLYSRYWNAEGKSTKKTGRTFEERIEEIPSWTTEAFYDDHLERYLNHFSRDSILILLYDELQSSPATFLKKIFSFLNVDDTFIPVGVDHRMNSAGAKPMNANSQLLYWAHRAARRIGLKRISSAIDEVNQRPLPTMKPETRTMLLNDVYRTHIDRLQDMFDLNLEGWRS